MIDLLKILKDVEDQLGRESKLGIEITARGSYEVRLMATAKGMDLYYMFVVTQEELKMSNFEIMELNIQYAIEEIQERIRRLP